MSGFSADWLALREPYDRKARNASVLDAVATALSIFPSVTIADLACGTGSTLRSIKHRLPRHQTWRLVDNDLGLLGRAAQSAQASGVMAQGVPTDLTHDLEAVLDGGVDLVTTSALLDLVSDAWLHRLAVETAARRISVYAALTYDGRMAFAPADPLDADIIASVNAHQRTDKGFGPALGPDAAQATIARFEAVGYEVERGDADWVFEPEDSVIQAEVLRGWAQAAGETERVPRTEVGSWLTRRLALVMSGRSRIRVGHIDLFARPSGALSLPDSLGATG
jgi:hypothetical protein